MTDKKKKILDVLVDNLFWLAGCISYSAGVTIFAVPNNLAQSGMTGVAIIVNYLIHTPIGITNFVLNVPLFILAWLFVGKKFTIKTLWVTTMLSFVMDAMTAMISKGIIPAYKGDKLLACIFCGALCGLGLSLAFLRNATTGGTDIIAAIVNKYRDVSLGKVIMLCDVLIVSSSYLVLHDWEKVIYGYVVLYISAFCIDQVVNTKRRSVQFFIISKKYKEIGQRINRDPHRGCTVINASGFYSGQDVKMLFVLARQSESNIIFQLIQEIDPSAFVSQSAVIGVYGEGFDRIKQKAREQKKIPTEQLNKL